MKNTKYSILELAMVNENLSHEEVFKNSVEVAQKAEELGYHRFWLAEHHNMVSIASSATSVLIGHIASQTKKIHVGSGGIMLPNHSPLLVAEQFGTLGNLFPTRIDLGLGRAPGTDQETAQAIRSDRMQSVYQFPNEVREIQSYFENTSSKKSIRATTAEGVNVPIFILGSSTDSAKLAAEQGLPYVFASHFAPAQLHQALSIYHNQFKASKYLDKPYTIAAVNVIAAETSEEAERRSTSMYRMMLGVLTRELDYMQPPVDMNDGIRELSQHPALQNMLNYTFIGNKQEVKEKTKKFLKETDVDEIISTSYLYHQKDRLESIRIFSEVMEEMVNE
ncbi:LLM class flavin-dependent oxidoreductase [Brumimicrobium mesophilum]|uniref:LLM class flavin-dependent oxidoreductase n=1 Tax=Brumimicrobium mesophilum TaxID=392717 RepID=UPI000D140516|nr:LLM class flavin-dependent oxidoreductase [Brumimicrobium mesophilum]